MADNRSILRLLILLVAVTTGLTVYASVNLERTLPPQLLAFVHQRDDATTISTSMAVTTLVTFLLLVLLIAGMVGMWWCRRWARWSFTIAALSFPVLNVIIGMTDPTALVSNAIQSGANSASDMSIGATLALIWVGMEHDFTTQPARESKA
ncbi:MAG TPA: hypothetical protein VKX28_15990 [Xanthobacteraceae bacterium]|nr:hypothetical protein [Xanthobacteraceae bacterium]